MLCEDFSERQELCSVFVSLYFDRGERGYKKFWKK